MKLSSKRTITNFKIFSIEKNKRPSSQNTPVRVRSTSPSRNAICSPKDSPIKSSCFKGPSFQFSSASRFDKLFVVPVTKRRPNSFMIKGINKRIQKNKNEVNLSPSERSEIVKSRARKRSIREQVTKLARDCIFSLKIEKIEEKIKTKNKKFSMRSKLSEINNLALFWASFFCVAGSLFCAFKVSRNRARLKKRNRKWIALTRNISKIIGKLKIILNKIRSRRRINKLKGIFLPVLKNWVSSKRSKNKVRLFMFLDSFVSRTSLYKVICLLNKKCKFIQNNMKNCLAYKKGVYSSVVVSWNMIERDVFLLNRKKFSAELENEYKRDRNTNRMLIPYEIKCIFIRKYLKEKFRAYFERVNQYLLECRDIDLENNENKWNIEHYNKVIRYPVKPCFPLVLSFFNQEVRKNLCKAAFRNRAIWECLVEAEREKIQKSYSK